MKIKNGILISVEEEDIINDCLSIPQGVKVIGNGERVLQSGAHPKKLIVPSSVEEISKFAFSDSDLKEIIIDGTNLKTIGEGAFCDSQFIKNVTIGGNSLAVIGKNAFNTCYQLKTITLPNSVVSIGEAAFLNSGLTEIKLPPKLTTITDSCFFGCINLKSVQIPENVTSIEMEAFGYCSNLENVSLPKNLETIGIGAFDNCSKLTNVHIPEKITTICDNTFKRCTSLSSVTLPDGITEISKEAFFGCGNLQKIDLPQNLQVIGENCFKDCYVLSSVTLKENVKIVDTSAFENCENLQELNLNQGLEVFGEKAAQNCFKLKNLSFPKSVKKILPYSIPFHDKFILTIHQGTTLLCTPYGITTNVLNQDGIITISNKPLKNPNSEKILTEYLPITLELWEEKDKLETILQKPHIYDLYSSMLEILPYNKFKNFYQKADLRFFERLYNQTMMHYIKQPEKHNFIKFLYNLGAFTPSYQITKTNKNGETITQTIYPAQKVSEFIINNRRLFTNNLINYKHFKPMGYNPQFTDFLLNKNNFEQLLTEEKAKKGFIARCYNEFAQAQKQNTSNRGSQRQLSPTVSAFKQYFASTKFQGITEENSQIAITVGEYFNNQRTFNSALKIWEEFKTKQTKPSLTKATLKEPGIMEQINKLQQEAKKIALENLTMLTDLASKEFTWEWLQKNDPKNFILGKLCSCCSHLEGVGYGIMRASIIHPNVQNLVIKDGSGTIIAKSTLYINPKEGFGVCNNVEVAEAISPEVKPKIYQKFKQGISAFATTYNKENPNKPLSIITVGMNANDLEQQIRKHNNQSKTLYPALNYGAYGTEDSHYSGDSKENQYVVWQIN
ncbi:MAG: leucine-rich repeat protein, partial [Clostridia bacterium]|nr:leucine-rich repeat protein [Clostridia bacterium]